MAFEFDNVMTTSEARERFATSRDTALAKVCRELVASAQPIIEQGQAIGPITLEYMEANDEAFGDFQTRQRDRVRAGEDKVQVVDLDGIYRKVNESKAESNVRAIRKNGGLVLVNAAEWQADIDARKAAGEATDDSE